MTMLAHELRLRTPRHALRRFFVQLPRHRRRTALRRERSHDDLEARIAYEHFERIADVYRMCGFDAIAAQSNTPEFDRLGCERACLEEPRRPQPLVEPQ